MTWLENFLLNQFGGKLIARGVVLASAFIVAQAAAEGLTLNPVEVTGALMIWADWAFEWFKKRRMANPNSPAIQTDPKLGAVPVP